MKRKFFTLALSMIACCYTLVAQQWSKVYPPEVNPSSNLSQSDWRDAVELGSHKFVIGNFETGEVLLLDSLGNLLADLNLPVIELQIEPTPDGGLIYCGLKRKAIHGLTGGLVLRPYTYYSELITGKINAQGNFMWEVSYEDPANAPTQLEDVEVSGDGSIFITGYTALDPTSPPISKFLIKMNTTGNILWNRSFDEYRNINAILPSSNGGVFFIGAKVDSSAVYDQFVRLNMNGDTMWTRNMQETFHYTSHDWQVLSSMDGGFYLREDNLIKIDALGNEIWNRSSFDHLPIVEGPDSNLFLIDTEITGGVPAYYKPTLIKVDHTTGFEIWKRHFTDATVHTYGNGIILTSDVNLLLVGSVRDTTSPYPALVIKTDTAGFNPVPVQVETIGSTLEILDINNIACPFTDEGMFFNNYNLEPFYTVPKNDPTRTLFTGGLWLSGIDAGGDLHVAAQTYRQRGTDFWPGPLDSTGKTNFQKSNDWDKIWKVSRYQVERHIALAQSTFPSIIPHASIDPAILEWPGKGNIHAKTKNGDLLWVQQEAAPFFDVDGDNNYNPEIGDYPDIKGDEMIWYVFNDALGGHTESGGRQMGVEVQISAYGYNCPDDSTLDNTIFIDYKIINKSSVRYDSVYIGKFVDFDIGCLLNDYIGCDTASNTFYAYNGTSVDSDCNGGPGYGTNPPIQTVTFLDQKMTAFIYHSNDQSVTGNPRYDEHFYTYMKGLWTDSTRVSGECGSGYAGAGPYTTYVFSDNPSDTSGLLWSDCACNNVPADRRGVGSVGPYTFMPDSVFEMTMSYTTHFLPYSLCPDFTPYRQRIDSLKFKFDNNLLAGCETYHFTCDDPDSTGFTCVWPGDASDDGIANIQDIFPIGIAYGDSFAARPNASNNWIGQPMQDWPLDFTLIGGNHKHADCNGDAVIDSFDFQPILDNYGLVHFKGSPSNKAGLPLTLEVQQGPFTAGSTVSVDVLLGTQTEQVPDFYAMAFTVAYNKDVVQPGSITIDLGNSWAGTRGVDFMGIRKELSAQGRVDIGVTRIDRANRAGFGRIATINYILIDDIAGKDGLELATLSPWIVDAKAIRNDETEISLFLSVDETPDQQVSIYPNPAGNLLNVEIPASQQAEWVRIYDSVGKEFFKTRYSGQRLTISTEDFAEGIYFVEVSGSKTRATYKVAILR